MILTLHVEVKIRVIGDNRESTEVRNAVPYRTKSCEIPEAGDLSHIMGGSYGWAISIRDRSSKGATDPLRKEQCD